MNKTVENLESNTENVTPQQLQEYSNLIKQRAQFYREENAQMEEIFKKLKLLSDELKLIGLGNTVENLDKFMAEFEKKTLTADNTSLVQAERLRKHSNYLSKLKICIKFYMNLNDTLSKEIKLIRCELEHSKENVNNMLKLSPQDVQQLEEKARKYENELTKLEKKYPWLKNSEYDLPNINKHIDSLNSLKEEKDNLVKELSVYQNLKPDIREAKQQLAELKEQMKTALENFKI